MVLDWLYSFMRSGSNKVKDGRLVVSFSEVTSAGGAFLQRFRDDEKAGDLSHGFTCSRDTHEQASES